MSEVKNLNKDTNSPILNDDKYYNTPINPKAKPQKNIGIDVDQQLFDNILSGYAASKIDMSVLNGFSQMSQSRDQIYSLLDTMAEDPTIAAVLETYAEDATEYNDSGRIVWSTSSDPNINKFITYLLDTMNVDKNVYKWVYSLCKYGDIYLRLFRESEMSDPIFGNPEKTKNKKLHESKEPEDLKEDVYIQQYSSGDKYTHYVEMEANPAELFELTQHGKTQGYIKAPTSISTKKSDTIAQQYYKYNFRKKDITIYSATEYVHGTLDDNSSRTPEEVNIFIDDPSNSENSSSSYSYSVKRGQSLLYNTFKIWRELMLLENSVLLNRLTKSSIVRMINVEVGDMPKEKIGPHLNGIKQLIEQKSAINEGQSLDEYTNPGPIENNIYIPTHDGVGQISSQQIGGDVDVKSLADLDYFKNKFFGCLRSTCNLRMSDGSIINVKDAFNHPDLYLNKKINSLDEHNNIIEANIEGIFETEIKKEFIQFELEDGSVIEVTPEHRMMLADGSFKQAKELTEEDELMSL